MSTNALIKVEGSPVVLYKHYDGYESATLPWLDEFNSTFVKERGNDIPYKVAQLIRSSVRLGEKYDLDNSTTTGWGVWVDDGSGYEFMYTLRADGTVDVERG